MATTPTRLVTAEDLLEISDEYRYDLILGELQQMSPAGSKHGRIAYRVAMLLGGYVEDNDAGELFSSETGFILGRDPDVVLGPDVAFVRAERFPPELDDVEGFLELAPDLVVEVVSPGDEARRRKQKIELYLAAGVSLVWIVEPRRQQLTVYSPDQPARVFAANDVLDGGDILPGFTLTVGTIFQNRRQGSGPHLPTPSPNR